MRDENPKRVDSGPGSDLPGPALGWWRALLSVAVIMFAGYVFLVWVPNWCLRHLDGLSRRGRVTIATAEFLVAIAVLAFTLRRLQARRVI